ncbi:hypothetical protein ABFS83_06G134600 [Erythranthe nasuta]
MKHLKACITFMQVQPCLKSEKRVIVYILFTWPTQWVERPLFGATIDADKFRQEIEMDQESIFLFRLRSSFKFVAFDCPSSFPSNLFGERFCLSTNEDCALVQVLIE